MYEKAKIMSAVANTVSQDECAFCQRPRSVVYCKGCYHRIPSIRVRKQCPNHPKELFLMDLNKCPNCKSADLCEAGIDEIPTKCLRPQPPQSKKVETLPTQQSRGFGFATAVGNQVAIPRQLRETSGANSAMEIDDTLARNIVEPSILKPPKVALAVSGKIGTIRINEPVLTPLKPVENIRSSLATALLEPFRNPLVRPSMQPHVQVQAVSACACARPKSYVLCSLCGYYATGVKKFVKCEMHPQVINGLDKCPDCEAPANCLDEGG